MSEGRVHRRANHHALIVGEYHAQPVAGSQKSRGMLTATFKPAYPMVIRGEHSEEVIDHGAVFATPAAANGYVCCLSHRAASAPVIPRFNGSGTRLPLSTTGRLAVSTMNKTSHEMRKGLDMN